jgi:hypothetical protein
MRSATIIRQIYQAFRARSYPGDDDIVRCEYDRRWGGSWDGPCRECSEVADYFRGKGNKALEVDKLAFLSFGLIHMSDAAFLFWLPSYLAAGIRATSDSNVLEGLEFRFFPPRTSASERWQHDRLPLLSAEELGVTIRAFEHMTEQGKFEERERCAVVGNLSRWRRPGAS